ncbi:hypothetical protein SmJEL517_g01200 [Synchytrium microbalum]|uniref:AMP-dependent synthetase/ligase domain-containing protein n=1 Tax=Synchytrium microbalum TaxID=1806994 RepID=A0A507CBK1_9FUNG|nr:uncharacterized protein SmJEL517_g01200 [Synchytrium microbalum]TPX36708.1 hypothetical protein SmJEL517_g01200 [Synchytrium microbalum]
MQTPLEVLIQVAREEPDLTFLKAGNRTISYSQAWQLIRQIAQLLINCNTSHSDNIKDGERISSTNKIMRVYGMHVTAEIDFVLGVYAIWLIGGTACVFNKDWSSSTRKALAERLDIHVMVYSALGTPVDMPGVLSVDISQVSQQTYNESVDMIPLYAWITHTSGTTGIPKSTVIKMKTIAHGAPLSIPAFALKQYALRDLASAPTFLYATSTVSNAPYVRSTLLLPPPDAAMETTPSEGYIKSLDAGVRNVHITPSILTLVRDAIDGSRVFDNVDIVTLAGEMVTSAALIAARSLFPKATIRAKWSQTELMWVSFVTEFAPTTVLTADTAIEYTPVSGQVEEVILLDEDGNELPKIHGTRAILAIVSPGLMATGYYGALNSSTSESFKKTHDGRTMLVLHDYVEYREGGKLVPKGRSNRRVKLNGLYVDLEYLDQLLQKELGNLVSDVAVMKSSTSNMLVLLYTSPHSNGPRDSSSSASDTTTLAMSHLVSGDAVDIVLVQARQAIQQAGVTNAYIHISKHMDAFPMTVSYKRHLAKLQKVADQVIDDSMEASGTELDTNDALAHDISQFCATLIGNSRLRGNDFDLLQAGFTSFSVMRLVFYLRNKHQYRTDAMMLLEPDTKPSTIAKAIRDAQNADESKEFTTGSVYEVPQTAQRCVAVYIDQEIPIPLAGAIINHYRRRIIYEFNIQFIYRFQPDITKSIDIPRLDKACELLCQKHPVLRSRQLYGGVFGLPQVIAQNFGSMTNYAVIQAKGHKIITVSEKVMFDHTKLQRILKYDLSRLNTMLVVVVCPTVSFAYLGMSHMVFELETHRLYKEHLKMLYEDLDRKDIPVHRILTRKLMTEESTRRLPTLPNDIPIFKMRGLIPPQISVNYFTLEARLAHPETMIGAFATGLLQILRPASTLPDSETIGFCSLLGVIKPGYSGNGLAETYHILNIPFRDLTLDEALQSFSERKTYFVPDRNINKYRSHVFLNMRTHDGEHHPRDQHVRDISQATWPSSQGMVWAHFDIFPNEGRISATIMKSRWIKKDVRDTLVGRYLDVLESWGIRAEAVVAEGLPIS